MTMLLTSANILLITIIIILKYVVFQDNPKILHNESSINLFLSSINCFFNRNLSENLVMLKQINVLFTSRIEFVNLFKQSFVFIKFVSIVYVYHLLENGESISGLNTLGERYNCDALL